MFRKKIICIKAIFGIFILSLILASCQRDDICPASTITTPRVRISFFDFEDRDIPKPPINLLIKIADTTSPDSDNRLNVSDISLPLRTNSNFTEYDFILNAAVPDSTGIDTIGNTDRIQFSYIRDLIYINRACGYKVNYIDLDAELIPVEESNSNWIREINIVQDTIANEIDPHIFIYY